ncbi:efflux RND transporter periplasmic adaptor subunit [Aquabacterium sp.]|uniref:efflux RND transporter periplasmic adaptor subunit n=1 Tax=Aquabacterium sp. TaxID=1872578 RepID=UPI0035B41905
MKLPTPTLQFAPASNARRPAAKAVLAWEWTWLSAWLVGAGLALAAAGLRAEPARTSAAAPLQVATVQSSASLNRYTAEGAVEAVRDSRIAAQVAGRITEVLVKAGDAVKAGQVLLRIDPSVASEQVSASRAQLAQAQAMLASARSDFERAQRLHAKQYVSDAAFEHAQTQYTAAQAQAQALRAQAQATGAQADFYTLRAPYAGWVSRVEVSAGDLATPGRPLLAVYDPSALRVTATVPESMLSRLDRKGAAAVQIAGLSVDLKVGPLEVLPALDAATHTAVVRVALTASTGAASSGSLQPGQFARLQLPLLGAASAAKQAGAYVPRAAVVQRGELSAVYVVDDQGRPALRQVRLGREQGDLVEVLAGLSAGEHVALDPVAAARR